MFITYISQGKWVYIGGFGTEAKDAFLEQVFGLAGNLLQWKGALNPLTEKSLGFGFGEFEGAVDAAQAVLVLNGLKLTEDGFPLVAKMDNRDSLKEPTEQQKTEAETIRDKVNFFIQNFSSSLLATAAETNDSGSAEEAKSGDGKEEKKAEGEGGEKDTSIDKTKPPAEEKAAKEERKKVGGGKRNPGYSEEVSEEEIKEVIRLEPRPDDMADEIWNDIVEFREMQAKHEILNDRKRKNILLKEVQKLRDAREKERKEKEKEEQEKLALTQQPKEEVVKETKKEPEVIDYTLKKDVNFGTFCKLCHTSRWLIPFGISCCGSA